MDIRPYVPGDRDACLSIFDSNMPDFFQPTQRREYEEFLNRLNGPYFVMEHDGAIVGCGGYVIDRLVWGMVRRDWQRQGLGRFLLLFRIREISKAGGVQVVWLETPSRSAPFFESQGFKTHAAGMQLVEMRMKLAVCP